MTRHDRGRFALLGFPATFNGIAMLLVAFNATFRIGTGYRWVGFQRAFNDVFAHPPVMMQAVIIGYGDFVILVEDERPGLDQPQFLGRFLQGTLGQPLDQGEIEGLALFTEMQVSFLPFSLLLTGLMPEKGS